MSLFKRHILHKIHFQLGTRSICKKVNQVTKRGSMLAEMIKNTDKRKNWHFEILTNNARSKNVFEKVSRPSKRQNVLNALFIRNITDVLSTGDIAPEVLGCGIELTGVKVSPCCKILNVYWRSSSSFMENEDIGMILNKSAHKLRAELISRNLMGRVPQIFFIRDATDAYLSAFEKALKEVEMEQKEESSSVVPDDTFTSKKKKIYVFTDSKPVKEKNSEEIINDPVEVTSLKDTVAPQRPFDMKSDVLGLNHDVLMSKVKALKDRVKMPLKTNVITSPVWEEGEDLFSKIPGTTIHSDSNREELLKQFYIERKKLMKPKHSDKNLANESLLCEPDMQDDEPEPRISDDDYIEEEETPEKFLN